MKKFIEDISVKKVEQKETKKTRNTFFSKRNKPGEKVYAKGLKSFTQIDVGKECAKIYLHFSKSFPKISEEAQRVVRFFFDIFSFN